MRKSNKTAMIAAGVVVLCVAVYFMMNGAVKMGYSDYRKKEAFQTIANVKLARQNAAEGFQVPMSNITAAVPIPMTNTRPVGSVVTLANNAQMPKLTMNTLSNAVTAPAMPTPTMRNPTMPVTMSNAPASVIATPMGNNTVQRFTNMNDTQGNEYRKGAKEGFTSGNYGMNAGGAKDSYEPIGAFDNIALPTGNNVSSWRYTAPDEPLLGAPFKVDQDNLFIFKNNQCKPECCGSSFSCSGGCVCSTPEQRQYIASRGGNRTRPQDD